MPFLSQHSEKQDTLTSSPHQTHPRSPKPSEPRASASREARPSRPPTPARPHRSPRIPKPRDHPRTRNPQRSPCRRRLTNPQARKPHHEETRDETKPPRCKTREETNYKTVSVWLARSLHPFVEEPEPRKFSRDPSKKLPPPFQLSTLF